LIVDALAVGDMNFWRKSLNKMSFFGRVLQQFLRERRKGIEVMLKNLEKIL